jgi:hypothetical protein
MVILDSFTKTYSIDPTIEDSYRKQFSPSGKSNAAPPPTKETAPEQKEKKEEPAKPAKKKAEVDTSVTVRSNFNPLANFTPASKLDAEGRTSIKVKIPDNLTRYR